MTYHTRMWYVILFDKPTQLRIISRNSIPFHNLAALLLRLYCALMPLDIQNANVQGLFLYPGERIWLYATLSV